MVVIMAKTIFQDILEKETSLALGCTEPMLFALGGAIARKYCPGEIKKVHMEGCGLIVMGVQSVGVPNTGGKTGAFIATACGLVAGDPDAGKQALHSVTPDDVKAAEELIEKADFSLEMDNSTGRQVYTKMVISSDEHTVTLIFEDKHDNCAYIEADGKVIKDERTPLAEQVNPFNDVDWGVFTIEGIWDFCKNCDISASAKMKDAIAANKKLAEDGLNNPRGIQVARTLRDNIAKGQLADSEFTQAVIWGTAGVDARMGGSDYPAMMSMCSGNQGTIITMSSWGAAQYLGIGEEETMRAIAFAYLINVFLKYNTKELAYMAPMCYCSSTASQAAVAGVAFLHGMSAKQINDLLVTGVTCWSGIICDGAKNSCAFRVSTALFGGLQALMLAEKGLRTSANDGFAHENAGIMMQNLYRMQKDVMYNKMDAIVWDIFKEQREIR